ncbi:hypothetical protein H0H92_000358 [Tricholoma furcatifolium]|nr:hypothetical protein H0H92_000358 [Tricholoma furcatifolium]
MKSEPKLLSPVDVIKNSYKEEEMQFLSYVGPFYQQALQQKKMQEFYRALRVVWEDRFSPNDATRPMSDAQWAAYLKKKKPGSGGVGVGDWETRLTIPADRLRRRIDVIRPEESQLLRPRPAGAFPQDAAIPGGSVDGRAPRCGELPKGYAEAPLLRRSGRARGRGA